MTLSASKIDDYVIDGYEKLGVDIVKAIGDNAISTLPDVSSKLLGIGQQTQKSLASGVESKKDEVNTAGRTVGKYLDLGVQSGIDAYVGSVAAAAANMIRTAINAAKAEAGISSPSTAMAKQVGKWLPLGMYEGFEDELSGVYKNMQKAINFENAKLQANVETGKVFNTLANTTPIAISLDADVEMDKTKVGRIITPVVSETLKTGGLR